MEMNKDNKYRDFLISNKLFSAHRDSFYIYVDIHI